MDFMELFFISLGTGVVVYYGVRLLLFSRMLFPKLWFPLPITFFTSMGEWAVVTGSSEGIGRAYAFALAQRGMNIVVMSRTKAKLDQVAKEIGEATGQRVKVIATDFTKENIFSEIEEQLKDLNIGVLDNYQSDKLQCEDDGQDVQNYSPRGKGMILNVSSGIASIPFPMYTLYAASKVFVERFSQGLQAEYKDKGIIIQSVAPFGVSTRMAGFQKTNMITFLPEDFVKYSLQYVSAGDKTNGSICHTVLGWLLQTIPLKILYAEPMIQGIQDYAKQKRMQAGLV
ncbi:testosterone 17-beta-dehydrogenase 3 isoform X2 [Simochromis diagramma]|uniref:testosterone 17-beta-dehydrogenase 3 isoform X2 n=1 Tax=Simochromis diagramma TaxID=43689 RepID=UPI001A7E4E95|nr:testosterone 17-beta-dehydrogenase 3 isoform X2 [Simochromis diagramma]